MHQLLVAYNHPLLATFANHYRLLYKTEPRAAHIPFIEDKNTIVKELPNPDKKNVGQVTNIN